MLFLFFINKNDPNAGIPIPQSIINGILTIKENIL
jgi:hypothetical protein